MSKHAQFTAVVKKMSTDDKKVVVNLEMVGKLDPYAMAEIVDMVGDKVVVHLGNPQMAIDFDEEERSERPGLTVTTDQSGVVTTVNGHTEDDHEDDDDVDTDGDEGEDFEHDEDDEESSDNEEDTEDIPTVPTEESEGDTPDPEQQGHEEPEDNTNGDDDQDTEKQEDAAASIDKEKLEDFILSGQAPVFDDFTFDFPELLQRKKNGETWIKIAQSLSVSSTKIASELREYKKRVAEHMANQNGEEPGAA
ncbi:hypothetical protein [Brevibacillus brevis]|uniref:hypothetical protein n=1 Tax=Brevibacillus brevis TaxID=1393 RepID=UPI00165DA128|nr:hypothetical protein [Brevibacillus brevis]